MVNFGSCELTVSVPKDMLQAIDLSRFLAVSMSSAGGARSNGAARRAPALVQADRFAA